MLDVPIYSGGDFEREVLYGTTIWSQKYHNGTLKSWHPTYTVDSYRWPEDSWWTVLRESQARAPLHIPGTESCTNCTLTVTTLGFNYTNCSTSTFPLDLSAILEKDPLTDPFIIPEIFRTSVSWTSWGTESGQVADGLLVNVTRVITGRCKTAEVINQECRLASSLVNYTLELNGGNATLVPGGWQVDEVSESRTNGSEKLRFMKNVGKTLWDAYATDLCDYRGKPLYSSDVGERKGLLSDLYWEPPPKPTLAVTTGVVNLTFRDPMDDILNDIRDIIFRLSVYDISLWNEIAQINNLPSIYQTARYTSYQTHVLYAAQLPALILATAISLIGPLATLLLFWGWWNLGRDFSMNPLELANAFLLRPAQPMPPSFTTNTASSETKHTTTSVEETTETATTSIVSPPPSHQIHNQLAALPLLASGSSNASAKQIVKHIRRRTQHPGGGIRMDDDDVDHEDGGTPKYTREPRIQYGVLHATGRLGFAVSDPDGEDDVPPAQKPRRGDLL